MHREWVILQVSLEGDNSQSVGNEAIYVFVCKNFYSICVTVMLIDHKDYSDYATKEGGDLFSSVLFDILVILFYFFPSF